MSHHNPRHPHRHHVRPKTPITIEDNGYKGLFWLIVLGTAAAIGLGYCLSQPPLPPAPAPAPVIQEPPVPISGPAILLPEERTAAPEPAAEPVKPHKAKAEETGKRHHKADDDEPRRHKRHHDDD